MLLGQSCTRLSALSTIPVISLFHGSIQKLVSNSYCVHKDILRRRLQSSPSKLHLSADVWTAPNHKAFLGTCVKFVDPEWKETLQALLALSELPGLDGPGSHGGPEQWKLLRRVLEDYNIWNKIGLYTGDNHASNDKLCRFLGEHLQARGINWEPRKQRIRCHGHPARAALEQIDGDDEIAFGADFAQRVKAQRALGWCRLRPLGKIHNISVHMRENDYRWNLFKKRAGRSLGLDNDTRWNSWFLLLDVALNLQEHVEWYQRRYYENLQDDYLAPSEWSILRETRAFLQPFWKITQLTEGRYATLDRTLFTMDVLHRHYTQAFQKRHDNHALRSCIAASWAVFDKYYQLTDESPAYGAAMMLHPSRRMALVKKNWPKLWQPVLDGVEKYWKDYYQTLPIATTTPELRDKLQPPVEYELLARELDLVRPAMNELDEYKSFVTQTPVAIDCSPLTWWPVLSIVQPQSMSGLKADSQRKANQSGTGTAKEYGIANAHNRVRDHLRDKHCIRISETRTAKMIGQQNAIDRLFEQQAARQEGHDIEQEHHLLAAVDDELYNQALVNLLTAHSLPHSLVEWPEWYAMLHTVNYMAPGVVTQSRGQVPKLLEASFITHREKLRSKLKSSLTQVHFSIDIWSSPNHHSLLGIVAHFIDRECRQLRKALLALRELEGAHSGEAIAETFLTVIDSYGLHGQVGYFTLDNAYNNDTMLQAIAKACDFDTAHRRLRCNGHIINLAVQAFLFGRNKDASDEALRQVSQLPKDEQEGVADRRDTATARRRHGALGMLHNLVVWVRSSGQRYQAFSKAAGRMIPQDNSTRWNSWYLMIHVAIKARKEVNSFIDDHYTEGDISLDYLHPEHWQELQEIHDFLQPFHEITKDTQWDNSSLDEVICSMDFLITHYKASTEKFRHSLTMTDRIMTSWYKFDDYYRRTDDSPVYAAAILLHPSLRRAHLHEAWKDQSQYIGPAVEAVRKLWEDYKPRQVPTINEDLSAYEAYKQRIYQPPSSHDEFNRFIDGPTLPIGSSSALSWWLEPTQATSFPNLYRLAVNIFSIPAMSAEAERVFSGARRTITWDRSRLSVKTIEQTECLKHWMKSGLLDRAFMSPDTTEVGANLPDELWPETWKTAVYLHNRSPQQAHNWKTPFERLHQWLRENNRDTGYLQTQPDITHLKAYGCRAYPLTREALKEKQKKHLKTHPHAEVGYLVGYDFTNIFRIWIPERQEVRRVRDVTFDETCHYDPKDHQPQSLPSVEPLQVQLPAHIESDSELDENEVLGLHAHGESSAEDDDRSTRSASIESTVWVGGRPISEELREYEAQVASQTGYLTPDESQRGSQHLHEDNDQSEKSEDHTIHDKDASNIQHGHDHGRSDTRENDQPRRKSARQRKQTERAREAAARSFAVYRSSFFTGREQRLHRKSLPPEPRNYHELTKHRFEQDFRNAMEIEWTSVNKRGTVQPIPKDQATGQVLPLTWVFKYKFDKHGYLQKFKARICVRGDLQQPGSKDTYAATLAGRSFRILMAITAKFDMETRQLDAINAFTNSVLDEDVYVQFPDGYRRRGWVLKLLRALKI
ncbi:hypothetical protein O9K51_10838 [Purpureocillium lavendulum]|uniref:Reverse transcriptase Ty1/copia-type domain-containing protein n=1 Tax=Purpureocillium lavendulum TaxID=1247861 RepID=A0AB34FD65_9HYPO|nr:hypothetical protein O9K51_10838 [Purpureocillium lavendulum]